MKEVKALLKLEFETIKKIPNEKIIALQRSMLELIGYKVSSLLKPDFS
jgi:hypothetical protein